MPGAMPWPRSPRGPRPTLTNTTIRPRLNGPVGSGSEDSEGTTSDYGDRSGGMPKEQATSSSQDPKEIRRQGNELFNTQDIDGAKYK